jgi:hypothetical protein
MSQHERSGFRSLIYSGWHRTSALRALIGPVRSARLTMIDIDSCEACCQCREPVALIETAHTIREPKNAPITALLARKAGIPAFSVSFYGEIDRTRCGACGRDDERGEITQFMLRQLEPPSPWTRLMTPVQYAEFLEGLRDGHVCPTRKAA